MIMTTKNESGRKRVYSDVMLRESCHVSLSQAVRCTGSQQLLDTPETPGSSGAFFHGLPKRGVTAQNRKQLSESFVELSKDADAPPALQRFFKGGTNVIKTSKKSNYKHDEYDEEKCLNTESSAKAPTKFCEPTSCVYCSGGAPKTTENFLAHCCNKVKSSSDSGNDAEYLKHQDSQGMRRVFSYASSSASSSALPMFCRLPSLPSFQQISISPRTACDRKQRAGFLQSGKRVSMRHCSSCPASSATCELFFDAQSQDVKKCATHSQRSRCCSLGRGNFSTDFTAAAAVMQREKWFSKYFLKCTGQTSSFLFAASYPTGMQGVRYKKKMEEELVKEDYKIQGKTDQTKTEVSDLSNKKERARVRLQPLDRRHINRNPKTRKSESFLSLSTPKRLPINKRMNFLILPETLRCPFSRDSCAQKEQQQQTQYHHHCQRSYVFCNSPASFENTPSTSANYGDGVGSDYSSNGGSNVCRDMSHDMFLRPHSDFSLHQMDVDSLPVLLSGCASGEQIVDTVVNLVSESHCTKVEENETGSSSSVLPTFTSSNADTQWTCHDAPLDALINSCFTTSTSAGSVQ